MATFWIVTANAGRARVFSQENPAEPLVKINDMINSEVHLSTADTESDRIGQRAASKSKHSVGAPTQPSGYQPNQLPTEHHTELFARSVADFLLQNYNNGLFQKLRLIASPEFLGILRKLLDPNLVSIITLEINKDYTQLNAKELREHIKQVR
ncbi:MAG: host attachment protein [Pseudomonadota bacterium]